MYIESLEVQNFKTLKNFNISFIKGFNLIIGKNNTGKSNVLSFLDKIYTKECNFENDDVSVINNTERRRPNFIIETSVNKIRKTGNKNFFGDSAKSRNSSELKSELNKIKMIYIDIQKEYSNLIQMVIEKYNELGNVSKMTYDSQINIEFSEVMGDGNSIFLRDDSINIIDQYADTSLIENKSSGVQRVALIICVINLFKVEKLLSDYVLLIDEPEGNLHVQAQKKMFDLLKSFSENHQVIISSHSTIFMQNLDLKAINFVERNKNKGSYIDNANLGINNFEKIRDSLGLTISDTLFLNNEIITVEGYSDVILHTYIFERLKPNNYDITFFTIEGADNALQNIITLKQIVNKDITIILDNDRKGINIKAEINNNDYVKYSRVFLHPFDNKGELEDMLPKEFLKETIKSFIGKQEKTIAKFLSDTFNQELEKYIQSLSDFESFSDIDTIGILDKQYSLKGDSFTRYIRSMLQKKNDNEFYESVQSFIELYELLE